jgi:hypothetical protein
MLKILPLMNSSVEEVFSFKSCCGLRTFDQNLEIQLTNCGDHPMIVHSYFDMRDSLGQHRIDTLMPHGDQRIGPGETIAFYCTMDETQWNAAQQIIFYDSEGNRHSVNVTGPGDITKDVTI